MTTPAEATTKSLSQSSLALNSQATYTLQYTTMNARSTGSSYLVTYPESVSASSLTTCNVIYNSNTYPMVCTLDTATRQIKMTGLNVAVPKGASL